MIKTIAIAATTAVAFFSVGAWAQEFDRKVRTSNGVVIDVHGDDFSGRYEYSAPRVDIEGGGFALVARIVEPGRANNGVIVLGSVYYSGEWRRYDRALLRGGGEVKALFRDRDVVSCAGSRYSGCSLREGFQLEFTPEQIAAARPTGQLEVQLRAGGIQPVMVSLPISYFDAVNEAANGPPSADTPAAAAEVSPPEETPPAGVRCETCR